MPIVEIDLSTAGLIAAGEYVGNVNSVRYQVKTGESWNFEGTDDVDFDTWKGFGDDKRRLQYSISLPNQPSVFHEFYLVPKALPFLKNFFKACGVLGRGGFDPEAPVGKQVGVRVGIKDDPTYGEQNTFSFFRV